MPTTLPVDYRGESLQLLRTYQETPTAQVRNQLVELNFGLLRREAHHWVNQCTESYEDLIQVGCIGLIRAIERFDLSKGVAFSSFALPYIRGEIQHYLRDKSPSVRIPRRWQAMQNKSKAKMRQLNQELGRTPTDAEMAEAMELSIEEWQEMRTAFKNRSVISLDAPVAEDEDSTASLMEMMPDPQYRSFQLAQEDQIRLQQSLVHLEQLTQQVLEFVFLHDLTQKETAERLGISSVTVSRRVKKGLESLRNIMVGSDEVIAEEES
ncbi:RNA polymerase sigma factor SigF [filamentous cyanobacterium LEGE 11480]|uniref:RNA polymerase sigma factor SigF n=1 Tax=Romeriopsis navalis LEGE 11480 TaxID=2777977 RepID=A0A928VSX7_9CYAN|nr:RNA polymerase sigma factor SigF [Romeriopsis navalis]MBE9031649.1 RNA polymerase sigma factor SigF [Romeriopsis navalis LEGE 11480]